MALHGLDISSLLETVDDLPVPRWDLFEVWIEAHSSPQDRLDSWSEIGRQWFGHLGNALGGGYEILESANFQALAPKKGDSFGRLLQSGERYRASIQSALNGIADFSRLGKLWVLILGNPEHYYRYISLYYPEGRHGGSGGIHINPGYPHIALNCQFLAKLESLLAHELTHASFGHLTLPQWVEEGLAQRFQHDLTGQSLSVLNVKTAIQHKRYWGKHGLDAFWRGEGFHRAGKIEGLSYQLAEILIHLLIEEGRPRWFGWVREPRLRLLAFLGEANKSDCGEAACQRNLGYGLSDLAAKFLGPGHWAPSM